MPKTHDFLHILFLSFVSQVMRLIVLVDRIKGDQQHFVRRDELKVKRKNTTFSHQNSNTFSYQNSNSLGCLGDIHAPSSPDRRGRGEATPIRSRQPGPCRGGQAAREGRLRANAWLHMDSPNPVIM